MDTPDPSAPFAAVILAGGAGSRMGDVDKATIAVGDLTLLERALAACTRSEQVVVVGPERPGGWWRQVRESPVGAGPAAALGAGVAALTGTAGVVVVLAVDMPSVNPATVTRLVQGLANGLANGQGDADADGAVLVGPDGRRQLAMALDRSALTPLLADTSALVDASLWRTLAGLRWVEVAAVGEEYRDVDTPEDLARARRSR